MATSLIVDLSHHNSAIDFAAAAAGGVAGVIHKATQGLGGVDPTYNARKALAKGQNLLWGAYHFGTGSEGTEQAEYFLNMLGDVSDTLLVLDLEANPAGPSMSLEEARAFVTHIQARTGKWPGLYSGHYIKDLLATNDDPVLANCWFWLAQYGPTAVVPHNWADWTLWQYTDGSTEQTPGLGHCDRDHYRGNASVQQWWQEQTA